jgi:hypothetical protein
VGGAGEVLPGLDTQNNIYSRDSLKKDGIFRCLIVNIDVR